MEMPALWSQINLTLCGVDLEVSYSSSPKQCAKLLPLRSQKKKKILDAFFLLTLLYVAWADTTSTLGRCIGEKFLPELFKEKSYFFPFCVD